MSAKSLIYAGMFLGSVIGGIIPSLLGVSILSSWSILTSGLGAIIGVWIGYKLSQY